MRIALYIFLIGSLCICNGCFKNKKSNNVVLKVYGTEYKLTDLSRYIQDRVYEFDKQKYELIKKEAEKLYLEEFYKKEAVKRKISEDQLRKEFAINKKLLDEALSNAYKTKDLVLYVQEPDELIFPVEIKNNDLVWYDLDPPQISSSQCLKNECKNKMILYWNFKCFNCYQYIGMLKTFIKDNKGNIAFSVREFPGIGDPEGMHVAKAFRCSSNAFAWQFLEKVAQIPNMINTANIEQVISELGVNMEEWKKCMAQTEAEQIINDNMNEAVKLYIRGVPVIFLNKKRVFLNKTSEEIIEELKSKLN